MSKNLPLFVYHSTGHLNKSVDTLAAVSKLTNNFTHEFDVHMTVHRDKFL
jgi:hypothetical protein